MRSLALVMQMHEVTEEYREAREVEQVSGAGDGAREVSFEDVEGSESERCSDSSRWNKLVTPYARSKVQAARKSGYRWPRMVRRAASAAREAQALHVP